MATWEEEASWRETGGSLGDGRGWWRLPSIQKCDRFLTVLGDVTGAEELSAFFFFLWWEKHNTKFAVLIILSV